MTTQGFTVSHARDAVFERGLRALFEYRDLGPPSIRHRELAHSDDVEMLEIVMPATFATEVVDAVDAAP